MTITIKKDGYGNIYAVGNADGSNFLYFLAVLCFIAGGIAIISGVLLGTVFAIIGTIFIYGGERHTKKQRIKKLQQTVEQIQIQTQAQNRIPPSGAKCLNCGNETGTTNLYCPNCGTKMGLSDREKRDKELEDTRKKLADLEREKEIRDREGDKK
jgi:DNA-directed RNA polymerase subunit RPC12/RpoP